MNVRASRVCTRFCSENIVTNRRKTLTVDLKVTILLNDEHYRPGLERILGAFLLHLKGVDAVNVEEEETDIPK